MGAAISAQNLDIGYKSGNLETIVSHIPSLELQRGKLTCLLGANGIGKSTLLKTITGNLEPLQGSIMIDGVSVKQLSVKQKARKLAVVLTDKAHLGFTTVKEMITLGRNPYTNWMNTLGVNDTRAIDNALQAIGMSDLSNKPLAELSDGNLQKVVIGRAIAQETDIIILDEPTIHLDITNKTIIVDLLRRLCHEHGKTILFSTHDLELAKLFSDQLWIMDENQLIQGVTEDIILQGVIEKSFKYDVSVFDGTPENIAINGPADWADLINRALLKAGINPESAIEINVSKEDGLLRIQIDEHNFETLAQLIDYLSSAS